MVAWIQCQVSAPVSSKCLVKVTAKYKSAPQLSDIRIFFLNQHFAVQCTLETMPFIVGKKRAKSMSMARGGQGHFTGGVEVWYLQNQIMRHKSLPPFCLYLQQSSYGPIKMVDIQQNISNPSVEYEWNLQVA